MLVRKIAPFLLVGTLLQTAISTLSYAQTQEISFSERFALADSRDAILAELIPGTDDYFYYHCLHYQLTGKIPEARGLLDNWVAKFGFNDQNRRMQTRQVLLEYSKNPQATTQYLISEFGIQISHPAPRKDEAAELATKLDPMLIDWESLLKVFSADIQSVESNALSHLKPFLTDNDRLRAWLARCERSDDPDIVALVARELKLENSQGFGSFPIHNALTHSQLIELQKQIPRLRESQAFVQARLRKIRPNDDLSLGDESVLRDHLTQLETFTQTLPESQASLKAMVLFHRLALDERNGDWNRERFLRFLSLPCGRNVANPAFLSKLVGRPLVDRNANFQAETLLSPIVDDSQLIERYLQHFFQADANVDGFAEYLDRDYLNRMFASTKILYGIGDSKIHYAKLAPDAQRELQARIELNYALNNTVVYKPSDRVKLTLDLKNTPEVLVKIYRVNARNVLQLQKQAVNTSLDLDGLMANIEKRLSYALPADRRHRETIELPELDGGGVWVVDLLASGLRSRALIHKGQLHAMHRPTGIGSLLRVFDSMGQHVPAAKALFGEREFAAGEDGNILIPFGRSAGTESIILFDGPIASVQKFVQTTESYAMSAGFLVDPQSMLSGKIAKMVIRPNLLCNGHLISLASLKKAKLTVVSTDLDGISATQVFSELELSDSTELVKPFLVPQRLAALQMTLEGEVLSLSNNTTVPVAASHAVTINQSAKTAATHDFYLNQSDKGYRLEVRGRNGEPLSRIPVQLEFKLLGLVPTKGVRLATDDSGAIDLGKLTNVERFTVVSDKVSARPFDLSRAGSQWPARMHSVKGTTIALDTTDSLDAEPVTYLDIANQSQPDRFELLEYRAGSPFESRSNMLKRSPGLLSIDGLAPGTYRLSDYLLGRSTMISVVDGVENGEAMVGQHRILETNRVRPVHIRSVEVMPDKVAVQIGNHDAFTRVHVVANAFRPYANQALSLAAPELPMGQSSLVRFPSYYINSLRLDEEYQYVIQRQLAPKFLGSLLPQPSTILNPWELSVTQNSTMDAKAGDAMPASPQDPSSFADRSQAMKQSQEILASVLPDYEFLKVGGVLLTNGRCDEQGSLQIDRKNLSGLTSLTLVVVHPSGTTYRTVALPADAPMETVDRRLGSSFAEADRLTEVQQVQLLQNGSKHVLGEAGSTRVRLYSSIAEVFQLYRTLLRDSSSLAKLDCIEKWGEWKQEEKLAAYSDLACHELHLFLLHQDRPFFDKVVRPFLANKMQKQFMDDYVLDHDLTKYAQPWQLDRLNTVERVLLAKKLEVQTAATKRWLKDIVDANPIDSVTQSARFQAALMSVSIESAQVRNQVALGLSFLRQADANQDGPVDSLMMFDADGATVKEMVEESAPASSGMAMRDKGTRAKRAFAGRELRLEKGLSSRLYEAIESTRKWAESNYFRLPIAKQTSALVAPNAFWLDYLRHDGDQPFLSMHLDLASSNAPEAVMAMAVLGLPLSGRSPEPTVVEGKIVVETVGSSIAFVQGIKTVEKISEPSILLATQNIYLADEIGPTAKPVQGKALLRSTVYRQRLVLTNPSDSQVQVTVLQQIPQGAIPLENAKSVSGKKMDLAPFATQELTTKFYFPEAGQFSHFGSQIAQKEEGVEKLAIAIASSNLNVLAKPDSVDETSWVYIASWGTDAQVLAYLADANLSKTDLDLIAWRMADRVFYDKCIQQLSESGIFQNSLWAYSIKHNDTDRMQEYLERNSMILARVGAPFRSDLMQVDPVERLSVEHLDFRPLIVARTHMLGPKRVILNDGFAIQYAQFMDQLAQQASIEPEQRLAVVYYLILQNRIGEAIEHFSKIDIANHPCKVQHDYFAAYLGMLQGKFDEADTIATAYVDYPNLRWRDWFAQVRNHVAQRKSLQAGNPASMAGLDDWKTDPVNRILAGGREQQIAMDTELAPVLDMTREGDSIRVQYRNLKELEIRYYVMDVELLFSRNPFSQQESSRLNTIEPNFSERKVLKEGPESGTLDLVIPDALRNKNLGIEINAGGLVRRLDWYTNSLIVNLSPSTGRVQVFTKQGMQPLEGAYVKVYSREQTDAVKFFKDGYTDLRGMFEYTSLSTDDLSRSKRLAILVIHPEHGTVVREVEPPK